MSKTMRNIVQHRLYKSLQYCFSIQTARPHIHSDGLRLSDSDSRDDSVCSVRLGSSERVSPLPVFSKRRYVTAGRWRARMMRRRCRSESVCFVGPQMNRMRPREDWEGAGPVSSVRHRHRSGAAVSDSGSQRGPGKTQAWCVRAVLGVTTMKCWCSDENCSVDL